MSIEATLRALNEMRSANVITDYAIGGAVAAFLYIEPGTTFDLDVFIDWNPGPEGLLTPTLLNEYLAKRGYGEYEKDAIIIEGWAVQFLPLGTRLVEEALKEAVKIQIKGVPTRIFTREHLMALCLQTGRPKDLARLLQFIEEGSPNIDEFEKILENHKLSQAWEQFKMRYLSRL